MNLQGLILILVFSFTSLRSQIPSDVKHVYGSVIITNVVGHYTYKKTKKIGTSVALGALSSLSCGFAKELVYDKILKKGVYSNEDICSNIWGTFIGSIVLRCSIDLKCFKK